MGKKVKYIVIIVLVLISITTVFTYSYFKANVESNNVNDFSVGSGSLDVKIVDSIIWRFGFTFSILLLLLFFVIDRKIRILPVFYPTLINMLFWVALMSHQDYRYLWFIYVNTFFIFIFEMLEKKNKKVVIK